MPLYEYRCQNCGYTFEKIQSFSAPDPDACPKCGEPGKVERLLSAPAIQFKGSGFYLTDYGKTGGKPGGAKGESGGSGASTPASSSGSTPAAGSSGSSGSGSSGSSS